MQKFNKISLYSNVIKNLLALTYLPLIKTVRIGDYICEGRLYVLRCEIIKCTQSGYIYSYDGGIEGTARWKRLQEFYFGDKNGKLCTNYISESEGYDYKTHERLGKYLRNLRDMYGLNLMPLYNCFSNQPLENHIITTDKIKQTSANNNTKVYKVPIRFNQDYTICIENLGTTTIAPAFIRHNALLIANNTIYGNSIDITNQYLSLHKFDNIHTFAKTTFGKPIKIRFNNVPEKKQLKVLDKSNYQYTDVSYEISAETVAHFENVEDHLYMLIQVPKVFEQNIVILEGDYTQLDSQKIVSGTKVDKLTDVQYDTFYTHDLNLMMATSKEPRPFSPMLVEFLLWNAISTLDTINNDLDRLSIILKEKYIPYTSDIYTYPNYWVPRYRQAISDFINYHTKGVIQDNLGYVTKNIEEYIYKDII